MRNRGISLIELLVVVGVIAVIAAILFPVMASAKANAKKTTCISNMRQVSMAAQLYSSNFNEMLLPGTAGNKSYDGLLEPYLMIDRIWTCPAMSTSFPDRTRSIGLNRAVGLDLRSSLAAASNSVAESPSNTIQFVDDVPLPEGALPVVPLLTPHVFHACELILNQRLGDPITNDYARALTRHSGRASYAMLDGSAKSMKADETILPKVKWFVQNPDIASFVGKPNVGAGDCPKVGLPGNPPGRDPVTGS